MNKPHPFSPSFPTDERKKVGKKEKKSLPPPSPLAPTYSVRNTNNTTSWSTTSISRSLALFVTAFTQIVGARMYDNSPLKIYISHIFFRNFSKPFSFMGERERERLGGGGEREGKGRRLWGFTYTQNTGWPNKLDFLICNRSLRIPIAIRLEVSQITYMTFFVIRRTMRFGEWVD